MHTFFLKYLVEFITKAIHWWLEMSLGRVLFMDSIPLKLWNKSNFIFFYFLLYLSWKLSTLSPFKIHWKKIFIHCVLVCYGCHNEVPPIGVLNKRNLLSHRLGARNLISVLSILVYSGKEFVPCLCSTLLLASVVSCKYHSLCFFTSFSL